MKSVVIPTLIASSILIAVVVVVGLATAATATAASSGVVATGPGRRNLKPRGRILYSQRLYQDFMLLHNKNKNARDRHHRRRVLNTDVAKSSSDTVKTTTATADGASVADPFDCSDAYTATKPYV